MQRYYTNNKPKNNLHVEAGEKVRDHIRQSDTSTADHAEGLNLTEVMD